MNVFTEAQSTNLKIYFVPKRINLFFWCFQKRSFINFPNWFLAACFYLDCLNLIKSYLIHECLTDQDSAAVIGRSLGSRFSSGHSVCETRAINHRRRTLTAFTPSQRLACPNVACVSFCSVLKLTKPLHVYLLISYVYVRSSRYIIFQTNTRVVIIDTCSTFFFLARNFIFYSNIFVLCLKIV